MPDLTRLTQRNAQRWAKAKPTRDFSATARRLVTAKARYQTVQRTAGVPWWVVAVIHEREASQNWKTQLGQGDPLDKVSTHIPRGRGPFTGTDAWEAGANDALVNCPPYAARWKDWSAGGALTLLEQYNGLGYYNRSLPSPYIWSGTDQYVSGKYVADGVFSPTAVDKQLGCAGLLMAMRAIDPTIRFADETPAPPDVPLPRPAPAAPTNSKAAAGAVIAGGSVAAAAHQSGLPVWAVVALTLVVAGIIAFAVLRNK